MSVNQLDGHTDGHTDGQMDGRTPIISIVLRTMKLDNKTRKLFELVCQNYGSMGNVEGNAETCNLTWEKSECKYFLPSPCLLLINL